MSRPPRRAGTGASGPGWDRADRRRISFRASGKLVKVFSGDKNSHRVSRPPPPPESSPFVSRSPKHRNRVHADGHWGSWQMGIARGLRRCPRCRDHDGPRDELPAAEPGIQIPSPARSVRLPRRSKSGLLSPVRAEPSAKGQLTHHSSACLGILVPIPPNGGVGRLFFR